MLESDGQVHASSFRNAWAFDVILVHSFSRFFRDQFQLEF
jgi:hypothetical protein